MSLEAMKLALEALEADEQDMVADKDGHMVFRVDVAITALRQAIKQAEQHEPVAWWNPKKDAVSCDPVHRHHPDCVPLYTAPPPRQPLPPQSPCEMTPAERKMFRLGWLECEAAHGITQSGTKLTST